MKQTLGILGGIILGVGGTLGVATTYKTVGITTEAYDRVVTYAKYNKMTYRDSASKMINTYPIQNYIPWWCAEYREKVKQEALDMKAKNGGAVVHTVVDGDKYNCKTR